MYTNDASVQVETFPLAGRRVLRRPSRFPPAEMGVVAEWGGRREQDLRNGRIGVGCCGGSCWELAGTRRISISRAPKYNAEE